MAYRSRPRAPRLGQCRQSRHRHLGAYSSGWRAPIPTTPTTSATWRSAWPGWARCGWRAGTRQGALAVYTRALDIVERLARADPDNTNYQRDLAVSLDSVGEVRAGARGRPTAPWRPTPAPWTSSSGWRAPTPTTPTTSATWRPAWPAWARCGPARGDARRAPWRPTPAPWTSSSGWRDADPDNTRLPAQPVGRAWPGWAMCGRRAGTPDGALAAYTRALDICRAAGARRPRQHRLPAQPVGQPGRVGDVRAARGDARRRPGGLHPRPAHRRAAGRADPDNTGHQRGLSVSLQQGGRYAGRARGRRRRPAGLHPRPGHQ